MIAHMFMLSLFCGNVNRKSTKKDKNIFDLGIAFLILMCYNGKVLNIGV